MQDIFKKEGVLLLEDGTTFPGYLVGQIQESIGEVCFNTGMTGYQELFTDPSYYGQIIVTTTIHIGNYGITPNECESGSIKISGLVCKDFSPNFSRERAERSVNDYFKDAKLLAIHRVDTRSLIRHIRSKGSMRGIIWPRTQDIQQGFSVLKNKATLCGKSMVETVSTKKAYLRGNDSSKLRIAVLDLGVKRSILEHLTQRGALIKVFPSRTSFAEMNKWQPQGYLVSNGPGDPSSMDAIIHTVKEILNSGLAYFGICLGNQLLALATGINTYKMHNGHRGLNHPVKNLVTQKCEITSQNHGFAVLKSDVAKHPEVEISHINLNDNTIEGLRIKGQKAFAVQYHPEASPGTHDSLYLFDEFIKLTKT